MDRKRKAGATSRRAGPRAGRRPRRPAAAWLGRIEALVLDCDGVLTPGDLFYDENGKRMLRFDARDGFGLAALCRSGFPVAVLSGRVTDVAEHRLRELGITLYTGRCRDKGAGFVELCTAMGADPAASAFMGDDVPDLAAFAQCGLRIAVADAATELLDEADWVTTAAGGHGAVREVCAAILEARGQWEVLLAQLKGEVTT